MDKQAPHPVTHSASSQAYVKTHSSATVQPLQSGTLDSPSQTGKSQLLELPRSQGHSTTSTSKTIVQVLQARSTPIGVRDGQTGIPLDPTSRGLDWWYCIVWTAMLYLAAEVPLSWGFVISSVPLSILSTLVEWVLLVDVGVQLCTVQPAVMDPRAPRRSLWHASLRYYLRHGFVWQLLGALPVLAWASLATPWRLVHALRFLALPQGSLPPAVDRFARSHPAVRAVTGFAVAALWVHIGACVWRSVDVDSPPSVAHSTALSSEYVSFVYAAFGAFVLVGHASVVPTLVAAKVVSMVLSCSGIACLLWVLSHFTMRGTAAGQQLAKWFAYWRVPAALKTRIQNHLALCGTAGVTVPRTLLSSLPAHLRREFVLHVACNLAQTAPLLSCGGLGLLSSVIPHLEPVEAPQGHYVHIFGFVCFGVCGVRCAVWCDGHLCILPCFQGDTFKHVLRHGRDH